MMFKLLWCLNSNFRYLNITTCIFTLFYLHVFLQDLNNTTINFLPSGPLIKMVEVSINLIILCPFIKDIVVNKLNGDMIITVNWSDRKNSDSHVLEKRTQPDDFGSVSSQRTIFSLGTGWSNIILSCLVVEGLHHIASNIQWLNDNQRGCLPNQHHNRHGLPISLVEAWGEENPMNVSLR